MEYVSLDQTDRNEPNSNIESLCNITNLPEIDMNKSSLNFENIKFHIKKGACKGKKKISKFRKEFYKKQIHCQNRASLIVHMVTNSPKDPKNLIFFSLILSGIGFLFPYNCLINAADYFQTIFCNNQLIYLISVAYVLGAVATVSLNNVIVQSIHFIKRINFGYTITIIVMFLLTILIIWIQILSKEASFYGIIIATCITSIGCAIQQSSFYGYSSLLPRRYTQALMIGESLSGVLASGFRISTYILLTQNPTVYFFLCIGQMILCLIIFHISVRSGFVKHHLQRNQQNMLTKACNSFIKSTHSLSYQVNTPNSSFISGSTNNIIPINNERMMKTLSMEMNNPVYAAEEDHLPQDEPPDLESSEEDEIDEVFDNEIESSDVDQYENSFSQLRRGSTNSKSGILNSRSSQQCNISKFSSIKDGINIRYQICKSIWTHMIAIYLAYFVTLTVFPGVVTDIESKTWKSAFPLLVMLTFNVSDFIGKISTSFFRNCNGTCLLLITLLRIPLIPLLIFCVIPRSSPYLKGDFWGLFLASILGISNGYIGCLPMLQAPQLVKENQKEISGSLMTIAYNLGLSTGVLSALQIKHLIIIPVNIINITKSTLGNNISKFC